MNTPDIVVIGAGPAGMAASITAAQHGATVTLIDEQPAAGGQIYRALGNSSTSRARALGKDYAYGNTLLAQLSSGNVHHVTGATVWSIEAPGTITYSRHSQAQQITARHLIIATGALERPYPIPGWTLPGVMTVGAAQILLKTSGLIIDKPILAGTGPLLYAVAHQILNAGGTITALVDTVTTAHYYRAARYLPAGNLKTIATGLGYLRAIKKAGVPHYRGASSVSVIGTQQAQGIRFTCNNQQVTLQSDTVLLHQGVVPNTQLSRSLGLSHHWHPVQRCFHPQVNDRGITSLPSVSLAGDGTGIGGAINAEHQGAIAALGALAALGKITEPMYAQLVAKPARAIQRLARLRKFLDILYAPAEPCSHPADDTIICRCEEITAGEIRKVAATGCIGPNQTKSFCRSGMGPCQGRYCGHTVTEILAATHGLSHNDIGYYRIR
ncbi:MAG: NAD(P)/FAD-dependent oxidoreductase, partial [Pseudomonadota bacterium]